MTGSKLDPAISLTETSKSATRESSHLHLSMMKVHKLHSVNYLGNSSLNARRKIFPTFVFGSSFLK
jgi:hypothetical protein